MQNIIVLLIFFFFADIGKVQAKRKFRYINVELEKSEDSKWFKSFGYYDTDQPLVLYPYSKKSYKIKIYYLNKSLDTLVASGNIHPLLFFSEFSNPNIIICMLRLSNIPHGEKFRNYRLIFEFYDGGILEAKYVSKGKIKL